MKKVQAGLRRRLRTFLRVVLSDSRTSPSSWRKETAVTCGWPEGACVARAPNVFASSRSRCEAGKSVIWLLLNPAWRNLSTVYTGASSERDGHNPRLRRDRGGLRG